MELTKTLLDTVEPDAIERVKIMEVLSGMRRYEPNDFVDYEHLTNTIIEILGPKVESLLSQCHKEALLEAVEVCKTIANDAEDCGATPEMLEIVYAIEDELRRTAAAASNTLEGGK